MNGFRKTAVFASVLSISLAGAAFAQSEMKQGAMNGAIDPPMTVDTPAGVATQVEGPSTGGSGPMANWPVYGSDGVQLGSVINTSFDGDNQLNYVIFQMANGNQVQIGAEGVARVGEDSLALAADSAAVMAAATAPVTTISVENGKLPAATDVPGVDLDPAVNGTMEVN